MKFNIITKLILLLLIQLFNVCCEEMEFCVLESIDECISAIIADPRPGDERDLMPCLKDYINVTNILIERVQVRDLEIVQEVTDLYVQGGPMFLRVRRTPRIKKNIINIFDWSEEQYSQMEELIKQNHKIWRKLFRNYMTNREWFRANCATRKNEFYFE